MYFFFIILLFDIPLPWQYLFQDSATPIMENIVDLHHDILFFLLFIIFFTLWILYRIISYFSIPKKNKKIIPLERSLFLTHNANLEIIWTLIPTFILGLIALPSYILIYAMNDLFMDPLVSLKIIGHQWYWSYEYADVKKTNNDGILSTFYYKFDSYLVKETDLFLGGFRLLEVDNNIIVPIFSTIRLLITSIDVIHSWTIPSLGIKMDAIPGRLNEISTFILRCSTFYGQCSELCGINHSFMPIGLESVEIDNYFEFIEQKFKKVLNTI